MFCRIPALLALAALPRILAAASSLPSGGGFTTGCGAIVAAGNTLTINQSTLRGIINWNNFSIGAGGLVTFNNGSGVTLNRVTGPAPSAILGRLIASGSVYLLNPEGILVGHGATVHTGGDFLASTLTLSGTTLLSGPSLASVVNLGNISSGGGNIYLIAHSVQNAGSLTAPNGTVGLAAGNQVLIGDDSTHGRIIMQAPGGDVVDSGFIAAAQAELKSNGGNIYALAGNNGGQIQATGTATQNGHIWLIAEHGTTNVSDRLYAVDANGGGGAIETSGAGLTANHGNYTFTQAASNATALTITPTPMPTPTPAPTPTPTGSPTVLTFAIGNTTDIQGSRPTFTAAYTGPAIQGLDIAAILAGFTFSVTPSPISSPGVYTVTATGAAPHGYSLAIAPATLTVVAGTPQVLPSQVPALPTLVPLLLPSSNGVSAASLLPPLNSAGLFQMENSNTELGVAQAPLAQSSFWIANTEPATYAAGAKPR
jgi:filamentous hemagglutinin family protein